MITFVFSMLGPALTDQQAGMFHQYAQWRVINERNERLLVDGIGEQQYLQPVLDALTQMGRAPIAIGSWHEDGTPVEGFTLNETAWLDVAPDDWDMTDPENPVPVRPTRFRDIHRWAGWGEKVLP
jgi:hypothetical protein